MSPSPPPCRGRARVGDPRRRARPAVPGRLRPHDHGRGRDRGPGVEGHPLPTVVHEVLAGRRRDPAHQGGAAGARGGHRQPPRRPGADGLRARRPLRQPVRRHHGGDGDRAAPRPRVRRGVPRPRHPAQDRDHPRAVRAGSCPRGDHRRPGPRPALPGPGRDHPAPRLRARAARRREDRGPGGRRDHHARRHAHQPERPPPDPPHHPPATAAGPPGPSHPCHAPARPLTT